MAVGGNKKQNHSNDDGQYAALDQDHYAGLINGGFDPDHVKYSDLQSNSVNQAKSQDYANQDLYSQDKDVVYSNSMQVIKHKTSDDDDKLYENAHAPAGESDQQCIQNGENRKKSQENKKVKSKTEVQYANVMGNNSDVEGLNIYANTNI